MRFSEGTPGQRLRSSIGPALCLALALSCATAERRAFIRVGELETRYLSAKIEWDAWKVAREVDPPVEAAIEEKRVAVLRAVEAISRAKKARADARSLRPAVDRLESRVEAYESAVDGACGGCLADR